MTERTTARDYHAAYESSRVTPLDVAERTLAAIVASDGAEPGLDAFVEIQREQVLADADASTARWRAGQPIGPLDGVPVPIKDEFDLAGYATRAGTSFRDTTARTDAVVVERLRRAGAIAFGKTAMTEIGLGGTGVNPGSKTPRNPYDASRFTGGSSSGSAAAVSSGIAPLALGSDAGGSVRMPAALCGIYGLKPTYGRIPTAGGALLAWTLDHLGPLGASVEDLQLFFGATADGVVEVDPPELADLTFAWCPEFGDDAEEPVRRAFADARHRLIDAGVRVEEVSLRWVEWIQRVGYITIAAEAAASQRDDLRVHRAEYNLDTRLLLAVGGRFTADEYLHAQRLRSLIRDEFASLLQTYDAFLSPTLACTAKPISRAALRTGEVNTELNSLVSRYTFAGTLTGFPCVSIPCGADRDDLPVGLHLMGAPHSDERLLGIAERADGVVERVDLPRWYHANLL